MSDYDLTNLVKQAIVVRRDLDMRKGKIAAQAAHASQEFIWNKEPSSELSDEQKRWRATGYRKIVLAVNSEAELLSVRDAAVAAELTVHVVCDEGLTQIEPNTNTCLAIGPHYAERLEPITKGLKLL